MDWYEEEVRTLEGMQATRPLMAAPAVFYGSSTSRLWTTLAQDLGDPGIVNLGFGGSTLAACVHFFERLVQPVNPGSLPIYAGDNDPGDGRSPEGVLSSLSGPYIESDCGVPEYPFWFYIHQAKPCALIHHEPDSAGQRPDTARAGHAPEYSLYFCL
jgi:hypothetical protein